MGNDSRVVYGFGYQKMYCIGGKYIYAVLFLQVEGGVATRAILSVIDDEQRTLEGWRTLVGKVADKLKDSTYFMFKDTSFNFVMDIADILPDTKYCDNIGQMPYDEKDRDATLELANKVSVILSDLRPGEELMSTFASLTALLKEIGTADISVVL